MLTCCRYIGRLLIAPSLCCPFLPLSPSRKRGSRAGDGILPLWILAFAGMTDSITIPRLGVSAKPVAVKSGFELCRDLPGDLGPPFLHRLEARQLAAMSLGLAVQLVLRLVEVDLEAAGLRDIPRRVAEHLDAVAFGIVEIDRPGVAVADWADALAPGCANFAEGPLHIGERADIERDLLHHRRLEIGLAARHEDDLVMVAGVAAQKGDAAVGCRVADHEAEDAGVEILHRCQVVDVEPDMAQAGR